MISQQISITKVYEEFNLHFCLERNAKIVFSGKYGTGKSYFLKKFFENRIVDKSFFSITISPVNYVVSSNEDIFDLIKIDVIKQLHLKGKLNLDRTGVKLPLYKTLIKYAKKKPIELVKNVSSCLSKVSVTAEVLSEISESVLDLIEDFEKFEKEVNKNYKGKEEVLREFVEGVVKSKNTYLENGVITQIISTQLEELKQKEKRRNVLIVEDFDRLDPAHIFRILNILSAHDLQDLGGNKFGFDKIVLVCDLDNIEHIYRHFYGQKTDFSGYMDKFYSIEPYNFDNRQAIIFHLKEILKVNIKEYALNCLVETLSFFIKQGTLSLRKIIQTSLIEYETNEDFPLFTITDSDWRNINSKINMIEQPEILFNKSDLDVLVVLRILKSVFGSYGKLQDVLLEASKIGYYFEKEKHQDIYKTLALPYKFIQHGKNYRHMLFLEYEQGRLQYPEVNMNSNIYMLKHKWDVGKAYKRNESFFNEVQIIHKPNHNSQLSPVDARFLFDSLGAFLTTFRGNNYLK